MKSENLLMHENRQIPSGNSYFLDMNCMESDNFCQVDNSGLELPFGGPLNMDRFAESFGNSTNVDKNASKPAKSKKPSKKAKIPSTMYSDNISVYSSFSARTWSHPSSTDMSEVSAELPSDFSSRRPSYDNTFYPSGQPSLDYSSIYDMNLGNLPKPNYDSSSYSDMLSPAFSLGIPMELDNPPAAIEDLSWGMNRATFFPVYDTSSPLDFSEMIEAKSTDLFNTEQFIPSNSSSKSSDRTLSSFIPPQKTSESGQTKVPKRTSNQKILPKSLLPNKSKVKQENPFHALETFKREHFILQQQVAESKITRAKQEEETNLMMDTLMKLQELRQMKNIAR